MAKIPAFSNARFNSGAFQENIHFLLEARPQGSLHILLTNICVYTCQKALFILLQCLFD